MRPTTFSSKTTSAGRLLSLGAAVLTLAICVGQQAKAQQYALELSTTADTVAAADRPVQIRVLRWSSDEQRDAIATAWTAPESTRSGAGNGNGRGGGGGGGFGGGGGRGRGGDSEPEPITPVEAVTSALEQAPTLGYIWTDSPAGHSIKYAVRLPLPDGGERIILAVTPRLDAYSSVWTATASMAPTDYEFTLIELRLDVDGGEGRTSLTSEIALEDATRSLVLEDFAAAPVIFDDLMR